MGCVDIKHFNYNDENILNDREKQLLKDLAISKNSLSLKEKLGAICLNTETMLDLLSNEREILHNSGENYSLDTHLKQLETLNGIYIANYVFDTVDYVCFGLCTFEGYSKSPKGDIVLVWCSYDLELCKLNKEITLNDVYLSSNNAIQDKSTVDDSIQGLKENINTLEVIINSL